METDVHCPKCGVAVEETPAHSPASHCPNCGIRVACPQCGSALEMLPEANETLVCSTCGEWVTGQATIMARTASEGPVTQAGSIASPIPVSQLAGFELLAELGQGGMGIVYRARQFSLNRDVAIKVLKPGFASNPSLLARFRSEAETAGRLTDAHILPVFDVLDCAGQPVLVLPYIVGSDLRKIIAERFALRNGRAVPTPHPWATLPDREYLGRILPLLDQLVDAVAAMHAANVLHRDIKPSNVLVDLRGNAWLADFGLARLGENGQVTGRNARIGTPGYMSPEQMAGELNVDARSDLFALGVTLYQALTLELAYGVTGANLSAPLPAVPSRRQRLLSRDLDAVVLKALEPNRVDRYDSATELREDWQLARQGLLPRARRLGPIGRAARNVRRNPWPVAVALLLLLFVGFMVIAPRTSAPDVVIDPNRIVRVVTEPAGAQVVLVPIDEEPYDCSDGEPLVTRAIRPALNATTPAVISGVPPGTYLVVAELSDHGFHEVYRTVPARGANPTGSFAHLMWHEGADSTIELPPIKIPQERPDHPVEEGMYRFKRMEFTLGANSPTRVAQIAPPCDVVVGPFFLDAHEVTVGEYRRVMGNVPPQLKRFDAKAIESFAVSYVSFDEAVAFAERVGKRIPTEVEYEFAATLGGTRDFPWGDDASRLTDWSVGPIGVATWDRTETQPAIVGLYSNVAEWTCSMLGPYRSVQTVPPMPEKLKADWRIGRVVRGGPWPVVVGIQTPAEWYLGPRWRHAVTRSEHHPGLGFRSARSDRPRFLTQEE